MSKLTVLDRIRFDEYFFDLAQDISLILDNRCSTVDFFYSADIKSKTPSSKIYNSTSETVILMMQEVITNGINQTATLKILEDLSTKYKKIICISTTKNALSDMMHLHNVHHVFSGPWFLHVKSLNINTCKNKEITKDHHWISLARRAQPNRLLAGMLLSGLEIEANRQTGKLHGMLRLPNRPGNCSVRDWYKKEINLAEPNFWPIIEKGDYLLREHLLTGQSLGRELDNIINENNYAELFNTLMPLYKNTVVEIINETTFFNNGIFITEKFLNSVYGYNLPIIISNAGCVEFLRNNGFDLFDDVIDHSYDKVVDPVQRIYSAITCNRRLLTDRDYAIDVWNRCRSRMDRNIEFTKTQIYDHFKNQCLTDFTSLLQKLGY